MIIVADASPLHYLVLIEQIDMLGKVYEPVLVPETVAAESERQSSSNSGLPILRLGS